MVKKIISEDNYSLLDTFKRRLEKTEKKEEKKKISNKKKKYKKNGK